MKGQGRILIVGLFVTLAVAGALGAAQRPSLEEDRRIAERHNWIYDDLDRGMNLAWKTGKPLMVVIRCPL